MRIIRWSLVPVLVAAGLCLPALAGERDSKKPPAPDVRIGEKIRTAFCRPVYMDGGGGLRAEVFEMALRLERLNAMVEFGLLRPQAGQLPYPGGGGGGVYPTPIPYQYPAGGAPVAAAESGLNQIALMLLLQGQGELLASIDRGRPVGELRQQLTDLQRAIDRLGVPCPDCRPRPMTPLGLQLQMQGGTSYSGKQTTTTTYPKER